MGRQAGALDDGDRGALAAVAGAPSLADQVLTELQAFASSDRSRLPAVLQEAWLFRRPWFERRFLVALVGLTDAELGDELAAARTALLALLANQQRLPSSLPEPGSGAAAAAAAALLSPVPAPPTHAAQFTSSHTVARALVMDDGGAAPPPLPKRRMVDGAPLAHLLERRATSSVTDWSAALAFAAHDAWVPPDGAARNDALAVGLRRLAYLLQRVHLWFAPATVLQAREAAAVLRRAGARRPLAPYRWATLAPLVVLAPPPRPPAAATVHLLTPAGWQLGGAAVAGWFAAVQAHAAHIARTESDVDAAAVAAQTRQAAHRAAATARPLLPAAAQMALVAALATKLAAAPPPERTPLDVIAATALAHAFTIDIAALSVGLTLES